MLTVMSFTVGQRIYASWDPDQFGTITAVDPEGPGAEVDVLWDAKPNRQVVTYSRDEAEDGFRFVPESVDYRAIVAWYLRRVQQFTGQHFLPNELMDCDGPPIGLNEPEWAELQRLAEETGR